MRFLLFFTLTKYFSISYCKEREREGFRDYEARISHVRYVHRQLLLTLNAGGIHYTMQLVNGVYKNYLCHSNDENYIDTLCGQTTY